jgi:hypothetical protein
MRHIENSTSHAVRVASWLALWFGCLVFLGTEVNAHPLAPGDPLVSFGSLRKHVAAGELCTLQVFVDDAVDSLSCMDVFVAFDTSLVECTDVLEGALYKQVGFPSFFRWKYATADTVDAVDCFLGYRSYYITPGELVSFVFRTKKVGISSICLAKVRLWDIDRIELSPMIGECAEIVSSAPVVRFEPIRALAAPGEICTLQVLVDDPVDSLSCTDIAVTFDTSLVECTDALEGTLYQGLPDPTFFRWKHVTPDTVDAVNCVLGYRTYILAPGELMSFVFRMKRIGVCHICFSQVRLWDIDRFELVPVVGACAEIDIGEPTGSEPSVPRESYLCNYPNPFNPSTRLVLFLAPPSPGTAASAATVTIYAPDGNRIRSLYDGTMPAGRNELFWDGRNDRGKAVAAGVYFAVAETEWNTFIRKLVLIR